MRSVRTGACAARSLAVEVAAGLSVGVIAYALFGGADFGSGSYDYKLTQSKSWSP